MAERSKELIQVGYYLSKYGQEGPPKRLNVSKWKEAYRKFYDSLNDGRTVSEFEHSLKNCRDAFDGYFDRTNREGWKDTETGEPAKLTGYSKDVFKAFSSKNEDQIWTVVSKYLEGFEIIKKRDSITSLIEDYKSHIETTQLEDERYKWELLSEFKGRPNTDAKDFNEEIKSIKFQNLMYPMAIAVLNHLAREKPEELRILFKYLFNNNKDLKDRLQFFSAETLKLYRSIGEQLSHHQDERSMATYLTFQQPEIYTFYKSSFYKKYCELLGIKAAKKNEKYAHYLELINQLIENYIKPDQELIDKVKSYIPDYYDGTNHNLLAQDILYQMLNKKRNNNSEEEKLLISRLKDIGEPNTLLFYELLDAIITNIDVQEGDARITYNLPSNHLIGVTIGQRYCLNVKKKQEGIEWMYIHDPKDKDHWWRDTYETNLLRANKRLLVDNSAIELSRSTKSSYRTHSSRVLEKTTFNRGYRNEILQHAFPQSHVRDGDFHQTTNQEMKQPVNTIFYGPPGSGKTFTLKDQYFEKYTSSETSLTVEKHFENVIQKTSWWEILAVALLELKKAKVGNLLEHPWVIKKSTLSRSSNVRATIWSTLQMHTVETSDHVNTQRRTAPHIFDKTEDSYWEILEEEVREVAPELFDLVNSVKDFKPNPDKYIKRYEFVTFHQSFSYEDFIEGIKPSMPKNEEEEPTDLGYKIEDGVFKDLCKRAENDPDNRYAIFIDEINRGNISQIFGELITLIEIDKRHGSVNEMSVILPYSKNYFSVPSNLDIYGTMNTADRSVEALDTALRRRFSFIEMMPDLKVIKGQKVGILKLDEVLKTINERVELLVDRDHTIGHSYFIDVTSEKELADAFNDKIVPLLQEYFYGDYGKIGLVLGKGFVIKNNNNGKEFADFEYDGQADFKTPTFELVRPGEKEIITAINLLLRTDSYT